MKVAGATEHRLPSLAFWIVCGVAIAVRFIWVLTVPSKPVGDFAMYVESATYLVEHRSLDDAFAFMPGWIAVIAFVQILGGGLLATKLLGAFLGGIATAFIAGITLSFWNRRAALIAAWLYALWPGGIAVSSVVGTDVPAATALVAALWCLIRYTPKTPLRATLLFGLLMGLGAYLRAVTLPLSALGVVPLIGLGVPARKAILRTALAVAVVLVTLSPWAWRNQRMEGHWSFTDSHGGLTALVGAYPNSDGHFTRALNRTFEEVTGLVWLKAPHHPADQAAYAIAKDWNAVSPKFSLGLRLQRASRLLGDERSLLYWPLYRQGVLRNGEGRFFDNRRVEIEGVVDGYWWGLWILALAGAGLALHHRKRALVLWPLVCALSAVYVLFFAESRYHLGLAMLLFPSAGGALGEFRRDNADLRAPALAFAVAVPAIVIFGFVFCTSLAPDLVATHRWAVSACQIEGKTNFCKWQREDADDPTGPSPVHGSFSGVGLDLGHGIAPGARMTIALLPGRYRARGQLHRTALAQPGSPGEAAGAIRLAITPAGAEQTVNVSALEVQQDLELAFEVRDTEAVAITLQYQSDARQGAPSMRVWLDNLSIERL
ncbi:MAG: glycosyltransferase family 39 protein [Deltaproteobacteria bacterium]|nr:glycosyltransferase family 39 protein [Deltaproteobacteria bacterium]